MGILVFIGLLGCLIDGSLIRFGSRRGKKL
jgi:hypothetical protein